VIPATDGWDESMVRVTAWAGAVKDHDLQAETGSFGDGRLTAVVPAGATTGRVSVTPPNGTAVSPFDLVIQPKITGFSPVAGAQ
jgi:hypothetical protein